jgi:hypothetical protein
VTIVTDSTDEEKKNAAEHGRAPRRPVERECQRERQRGQHGHDHQSEREGVDQGLVKVASASSRA